MFQLSGVYCTLQPGDIEEYTCARLVAVRETAKMAMLRLYTSAVHAIRRAAASWREAMRSTVVAGGSNKR